MTHNSFESKPWFMPRAHPLTLLQRPHPGVDVRLIGMRMMFMGGGVPASGPRAVLVSPNRQSRSILLV